MTRHEMREAAFILLYEMQMSGNELDEVVETSVEAFEMPCDSNAINLAKGVTEHNDELIEIISKYSPTRSVARMAKVNVIILTIALYEMKYSENVPAKVAINEAIELSKAYADKQDSSFINGILNSYYKDNGEKE